MRFDPYELDMRRREAEVEDKRWEEWKIKEFGEGPHDEVTNKIIDNIISIKRQLSALDSRTFGLMPIGAQIGGF